MNFSLSGNFRAYAQVWWQLNTSKRMCRMIDIFAKTFMTATRSDDPNTRLTRVHDVKKWDAPGWWRGSVLGKSARYIDLNKL